MTMAMNGAGAAEDWCKSLVQVTYQGVVRGQVVYERVRHNSRPDDLKWKRARVKDWNRAAVRIEYDDGSKEAMLRYADLWTEPSPEPVKAKVRAVPKPAPAEPSSVPAAAPAPAKRMDDDEYTAWLTMGRDMLASIDRQRSTIDSELHELSAQVDTIDRNARARIESLEAELIEAKREHLNDRAFAAAQQERLSAKLASLNDRRAAMAALMGDA